MYVEKHMEVELKKKQMEICKYSKDKWLLEMTLSPPVTADHKLHYLPLSRISGKVELCHQTETLGRALSPPGAGKATEQFWVYSKSPAFPQEHETAL